MAEQIILDLSIPSGDVEKATREIAEMRTKIEQLKNSQKNLEKGSVAYAKNAIEIKKLNTEVRTNERVLVANERATNANKGSVEQLREQLKVASVEWSKLSKNERENTERGRSLTKQKKDLTDQLKTLEKQTGDNRRNVGNYSEGMKEALETSGLFTREQQALATIQKGVAVATNISTKSVNLFKAALISTGIGAIIVALGSLITYLTSTQKGMDAVTSVTRPLFAIFERMKGVVQDLGGNVFKGLGQILNGDIKEGLSTLGSGLKDAASGARDAIKEGAAAGRELDKMQKQIERTEAELVKTRQDLNLEFERSREIAENDAKSQEERRKAAQAAIDAQNKLLEEESRLLDLRIEKKKLENSLNDTSRADQKALNELLAERSRLEAEAAGKRASARNLLEQIQREEVAADKALQKEREKNFEAAEKAKTEALRKQIEERQAMIEADIERNNRAFLNGLKQQLLDAEITREQYDERLIEREIQLLEALKAARILAGEDFAEIDDKLLNLRLKNLEREKAANKAAAKTEVDVKESAFASELEIGKQSVKLAKQVAGENASLSKAAALAQVGINIAESITKALAQEGPILGTILASVSTAIGAVQAAAIRSAPENFADGVIGLQGPGTETSDSISANLSRGESVMTAKATKAYAPVLADMERSVGNNPNYQLGSRRFANGIISAGRMPAMNAARDNQSEIREVVQEMRNMKIFLSLTELNSRQEDLNDARTFSRIIE